MKKKEREYGLGFGADDNLLELLDAHEN